MSEFRVEPSDVERFADTLGELAAQSEAARAYLNKWLSIGYAEGRMFVPVVEKVSAVLSALDPEYSSLTRLSADAESQLRKAAVAYRDTDLATSARLDSTY